MSLLKIVLGYPTEHRRSVPAVLGAGYDWLEIQRAIDAAPKSVLRIEVGHFQYVRIGRRKGGDEVRAETVESTQGAQDAAVAALQARLCELFQVDTMEVSEIGDVIADLLDNAKRALAQIEEMRKQLEAAQAEIDANKAVIAEWEREPRVIVEPPQGILHTDAQGTGDGGNQADASDAGKPAPAGGPGSGGEEAPSLIPGPTAESTGGKRSGRR